MVIRHEKDAVGCESKLAGEHVLHAFCVVDAAIQTILCAYVGKRSKNTGKVLVLGCVCSEEGLRNPIDNGKGSI